MSVVRPVSAATRGATPRRTPPPVQAVCSGYVSSGWSTALRRQVEAHPRQRRTAAPNAPRRDPVRMCGILGIYKRSGQVSVELYEGLLTLQHRGQDSAGMVTTDWEKFREHKANGLVKDVFDKQSTLDKLTGQVGIGHVRYPTAGSSSAQEAQPFFVNSPLGIYLIHNGNLTNTGGLGG
ncbi:amidophosphoribosyltransferase [Monoraphidium neglectum]|uniref:Amidophosphoribosyltransferase n=1 Tax=Monoraphidium neglectum TaxID=145388 RepID=A0A0D2LWY4_9CHLO|nr:amidophosphoribosyltransferase [Monoraphidium neglectum]KIY94036.1 amidophosphoribosyltransferase [Monoraphidium neglectum]|eukprot:XP_013893056.1 amidophosphoribosyltransferase [Monoraphidium neglectum]